MKKYFFLLLLLLPQAFVTSSCDFDIDELAQSIDDARGTIKDGIERLGNESEKWRDVVLKDIIPVIDKRLEWVIADLQTLVNSTIANAGSTISCTTDAFPLKIKRGLNDILYSLDGRERTNFIYPTVCTVSLNTIDMDRPASLRRQVIVSGYDFVHAQDFEFWIVKTNGEEQFVQGRLTKQTDYVLILDISNMDDALTQSRKLVVRHLEETLAEIPVLH